MTDKFKQFRNEYPVFSYNSYSLEKEGDIIKIRYDFSIDGLCSFNPTTQIHCSNLTLINDFNSPEGRKIVFSLGMVELISYWKSCCPQKVKIKCGYLDKEDIQWFKRLYFGGLGEFFYRNSIETDFDSFMQIECDFPKEEGKCGEFNSSGINIIPVGGGKDSNVSMELLKSFGEKNYCFTVNDQGARTDSVIAAGYGEDRIIKTYRTIDKNLLDLNKKGFLNGHTPFSAIVAFLSFYCGYIIGAENIILSNESSANESNISGTSVNHQYSKSYGFENDFNNYTKKHFRSGTVYFSLLRPFNELQIAKQFSHFKKYHPVFKSCNAGSKKNIWCCECAKCLFVYIILSPFLTEEELINIFSCNMLDKENMKEMFDGLCGFTPVKPFECIGTVEEVTAALCMSVKKYKSENKKLPCLLEYYQSRKDISKYNRELLKEYNTENNIPKKFIGATEEMYKYVSADN